jgi:raffinose/stachyose/melibiose transport system permease protein
MNKVLRNPHAYLLFVVPAMALYITFYLLPLFSSLRYSVTSWNGINEATFNGIDNFLRAFEDPKFWIALKNNLYFVLFSLFVQIPVIVSFAILVSGVKRGLNFYKVAVFLPSILSTAAVAIIWQFVYQPDAGLLNQIFRSVGLKAYTTAWLGNEHTAFWSILMTNAWQWTGFYIVLLLAAIFAVSKEVLEAATIDGAAGLRKAWLITIPLIRPVIVVVMLLSITGAMKALDIVLIMTNGGPYGSTEVMGTYMYKQAYRGSDFGYANTVAIIIFFFTAILSLIFHLISRQTKKDV